MQAQPLFRGAHAYAYAPKIPQWPSPPPHHTISWRWPADARVRMRSLVSRAAMRPIFRYPSWKLQREVQLESLLEHRVAILLDACPRVVAFAEQPAELRLRHGGETFRHVPDFAVVVEEGPQFLEVKFSKYVDAALIGRTARIAAALEPLGIGYRLITEHDMPAKVRETNARLLTMRARLCPAGVATLLLTERAAQLQQPTLEALGWTSAADARVLAAALLEGRLHADFSATLCSASPVSLQSSTEGWLWA